MHFADVFPKAFYKGERCRAQALTASEELRLPFFDIRSDFVPVEGKELMDLLLGGETYRRGEEVVVKISSFYNNMKVSGLLPSGIRGTIFISELGEDFVDSHAMDFDLEK